MIPNRICTLGLLAIIFSGCSESRLVLVDRMGGLVAAGPYREARPCREGYCLAATDDGWVFVQPVEAGTTLGPFPDALPFSDGLAPVRVEGSWGAIDHDGRLVVAPVYKALHSFVDGKAQFRDANGMAWLSRDGRAVTDRRFELVDDFSCERARVFADGRFSFVDIRGSDAFPDRFASAGPFSECLAPVKVGGCSCSSTPEGIEQLIRTSRPLSVSQKAWRP